MLFIPQLDRFFFRERRQGAACGCQLRRLRLNLLAHLARAVEEWHQLGMVEQNFVWVVLDRIVELIFLFFLKHLLFFVDKEAVFEEHAFQVVFYDGEALLHHKVILQQNLVAQRENDALLFKKTCALEGNLLLGVIWIVQLKVLLGVVLGLLENLNGFYHRIFVLNYLPKQRLENIAPLLDWLVLALWGHFLGRVH